MEESRTLCALAGAIARYGEATALTAVGEDGVRTTSFATLADDSLRLAAGLAARGVRRGETVAVHGPAGPEWLTCALAVFAAGAVLLPLDAGLDGDDLSFLIDDSDCRTAFTSPRLLDGLRAAAAPQRLSAILFDGEDRGGAGTPHWRSVLADRPIEPGEAAPDDIAALFYTSGTTGRPKGVPLSHANLAANLQGLGARNVIGRRDTLLMPLPLHHVYPLVVGALAPLSLGAAVAFPGGLSGPEIARALRESRATVLIAVPRLCAALLDAIVGRLASRVGLAGRMLGALLALCEKLPPGPARALGRIAFRPVRSALSPHLRMLVSGGARLDPEPWRRLEALGWTVLSGYGLTETAPILTFNAPGAARIGTAGRPLAGVEIRIDGAGPDRPGEITARGPNVFAGYRNLPAETAAAFTADGWFRTGDLGFVDADGFLHIEGRSKELIILPDGKNLFPETVEAAYAESPFIREIAVLEHDGRLVGMVVPDLDAARAHGAESLEGLIRGALHQASLTLPGWQRIAGHVVTRATLPRTAIGKLRRHLLPALYEAAQAPAAARAAPALSAEDRALIADAPAREIWRWLERRFPGVRLSMETSPQLDLGVDSLTWTGLSLEIEDRFGIRLSEARIARIVTLRDLMREAAEASTEAPSAAVEPEQPALPERPGPVLRLLHAGLYWINRIAIRGIFRLSVRGLENLPREGPYVIAPNHLSYLDTSVIAAALPLEIVRRIWFAGWTGLMFAGPVSRAFSRIARVFPVDADRAAAGSLALAREVLARGDVLVWFPEGARSMTGELQPFLPGIGVLLDGAGAPAVPTLISGTFEAAPRGRILPRPRPIGLAFGRAEPAESLAARGTGTSDAQRISDGLRDAVAALAG